MDGANRGVSIAVRVAVGVVFLDNKCVLSLSVEE